MLAAGCLLALLLPVVVSPRISLGCASWLSPDPAPAAADVAEPAQRLPCWNPEKRQPPAACVAAWACAPVVSAAPAEREQLLTTGRHPLHRLQASAAAQPQRDSQQNTSGHSPSDQLTCRVSPVLAQPVHDAGPGPLACALILPEGHQAHPRLPGQARQRPGLPCEAARHAQQGRHQHRSLELAPCQTHTAQSARLELARQQQTAGTHRVSAGACPGAA